MRINPTPMKKLTCIQISFVFHFLLFCVTLNSQTEQAARGFIATGDIFGSRVFIQNKGQFFMSDPMRDLKIFFGFDNGLEKIFFTDKGPVYSLTERKICSEEELEAAEHFGRQSSLTRLIPIR